MSDKPLNPGDLNCRVFLREIKSSRGPLGEVLPAAPVVVGKAWAQIEPISNRKIRSADQQQIVETCLFTMPPRRDISIDWQIVTTAGVFTVRAVDRVSYTDRIIITGEADIRHDRTEY